MYTSELISSHAVSELINSVQAHIGLLYFHLGLIIIANKEMSEAANHLHLVGIFLLFGLCRSLNSDNL